MDHKVVKIDVSVKSYKELVSEGEEKRKSKMIINPKPDPALLESFNEDFERAIRDNNMNALDIHEFLVQQKDRFLVKATAKFIPEDIENDDQNYHRSRNDMYI